MFGKEKIVKILNIEGMSCMHCVKKVETALNEVKGVKSVKINGKKITSKPVDVVSLGQLYNLF